MFKMIDADNSGQITFEELKAGLKRAGANLKESEIYDLMQAVSIRSNFTYKNARCFLFFSKKKIISFSIVEHYQ